MAASYPSAAKSFTALVDAVDYPQVAQVNAIYDEVTALEAALLTSGLAHNLFPDASANARTLGTSSKFWGLSYLKALILSAAATLTIASGVATAAQGYHALDTEGAAGTDDLDTITAGTGLSEGTLLVLRAANVAHVVTLKDGTGNLLLNGDCALSSTDRTITLIYDGTNWREVARSVSAVVDPRICDGRLTLTSGTAVTTTDVTGAGTIYFTPFAGNLIALYDGSNWNLSSFPERSLALTVTSGKNYDVFLYSNSGTLTLELSAAWTNDTTRADALTTQDGVLVKSGATTRRYLGTLRASGANTTEDSKTKRFVWNLYNRRPAQLLVIEGTDSWAYTTATWRQANGSAANQVELVTGQAEDPVQLTVSVQASNSNIVQIAVGIGEDSTSSPSANFLRSGAIPNGSYGPVTATGSAYPSIGYHKYCWLEFSTASGTGTWYGDNGGTTVQSGMTGTWWR